MKPLYDANVFPDIVAPQLQDLRYAILEIHRSTGAPIGLVVTSVLSAVSTAIQGVVDVRKPSGQTSPVSLMTILIADPGERKSTAERICFAPITAFERKAQDRYKSLLKEWEADSKLWKVKTRSLSKKLEGSDFMKEADAVHEKALRELLLNEPVKPSLPQILYSDATPVALFEGMSQRWTSAVLLSSEGGSLLNGALFADMGKLNSAWSGEDVVIDRARGRIMWSGRLTAAIQIQPGPFEAFLSRRGTEARDSGLMARFLLSYPSSTQGSRLSHTTGPLSSAYERYVARLTELMEETASRQACQIEQKEVGFSQDASALWRATFDHIESSMLPGNHLHEFKDLASRLMDQISRVAALLSYYSNSINLEVSYSVLADAVKICDWYGSEFMRLMAVSPKEHRDAMALSSKLSEYRSAGRRYIRKNSIRQLAPNAIRRSPMFDAAIEQLKLWNQIAVIVVDNFQVLDLCPGFVHDHAALNVLIAEFRSRTR